MTRSADALALRSPSLVRFFGARFVAQDQQTMVEQARGLRSNQEPSIVS